VAPSHRRPAGTVGVAYRFRIDTPARKLSHGRADAPEVSAGGMENSPQRGAKDRRPESAGLQGVDL